MARRTVQEVEEALRTGRATRALLNALPEGVDPRLAADVALRTIREDTDYHPTWSFARDCRRLPVPVAEEVLRRLAAKPRTPHGVFLAEALRDDLTPASWAAALGALSDLQTTYGWGSRQRKAKLAALARHPRFLPAIRAAVAGCPKVPLDMLAVLVADGSEDSLEALIPHAERAARARDRGLDLLQRLRTHAAKTPLLDALFEHVGGLLTEREAQSPALELARRIGLGALDTFFFEQYFGSTAHEHEVAVVQAHLAVDSRRPEWFRVNVSAGRRITAFDSRTVYGDGLGLGRCTVDELGPWCARAAEALQISWELPITPRTNLRGKKRARLVAWLRTTIAG